MNGGNLTSKFFGTDARAHATTVRVTIGSLARVGVTHDRVALSCDACGAQWTAEAHRTRFRAGWWKCPHCVAPAARPAMWTRVAKWFGRVA